MFNEIIEYVLRKGCGKRGGISRLLRSKRFQKWHARYRAPGESTNAMVQRAYRSGALGFHQFMLQRPEYDVPFQPDPVFRAVVKLLGRELIAAADALLPPEAESMAAEWRAVDSDRQVAIAGRFCSLIGNDSRLNRRDRKSEVDRETASLGGHFRDFIDQPLERVLPAAVGAGKRFRPNCLLSAMMTLAFARRCRAPAFLGAPISSSVDLGSHLTKVYDFGNTIHQHHRRFDGDARLDDLLFEVRAEGALDRLWASNFHAGAVLRVDNRRWVTLDPYAGTWGVAKRFRPFASALKCLHEAVPGISIPYEDAGQTKMEGGLLVREHLSALPSRLEVSNALTADLEEAISHAGAPGIGVTDITEIISRSDLYRMILREENVSAEDIAESGGDVEFAFQLLSIHAESPEALFTSGDALQEAIRRLSGYPLQVAARDFRNELDRLFRSGKIIHPLCEYTDPEFGVGLRVLREAAIAFEDFDLLKEVTAESSSQTSLYDRIHFFDDEAARDVACALDHEKCHSAVRTATHGTMLLDQSPEQLKESSLCLGTMFQTLGLTSLESSFEEDAALLLQSAGSPS